MHSVQLGIDYSVMATDQAKDPEVQSYKTICSNLALQDIPIGTHGVTLLCDTSTGQTRPVVPATWRRQVFDLVHGLSHPSIRATRKLIASKFVWKSMQKQIGDWVKHASLAKVQRFTNMSRPP